MNREIKFRGRDIKSGNWVYDDLIHGVNHKEGKIFILPRVKNLASIKNCDHLDGVEVDPKTVGQFTGLRDKNGKEIYEGDILCNDTYKTWDWRGVVKFSHGVFGAEWLANEKSQSMVGSFGQKHNLRRLDDDIIERQVVIGNIFEHPNLLNP